MLIRDGSNYSYCDLAMKYGNVHANLHKLKMYSASPFQPGGQEAICKENRLHTQILYRKIRRYTPTRNESSWVLEEDRFIRYHTPI